MEQAGYEAALHDHQRQGGWLAALAAGAMVQAGYEAALMLISHATVWMRGRGKHSDWLGRSR